MDIELINAENYPDHVVRSECDYGPVVPRLRKGAFVWKLQKLMQVAVGVGESQDLLKKFLFYGKGDNPSIGPDDIVDALSPKQYMEIVKRLEDPTTLRLLHAIMGIQTEAGELQEQFYAHVFEGKPLDVVNLFEEGGDVCWYLGLLCKAIGRTLVAMLRTNIAKLFKRYPEKFTEDCAINRDLAAEQQILNQPVQ